jgi:hypothetical protein
MCKHWPGKDEEWAIVVGVGHCPWSFSASGDLKRSHAAANSSQALSFDRLLDASQVEKP